MEAQSNTEITPDRSLDPQALYDKLYRDLRAHNERRAIRARFLDARRRQMIERAIQIAREPRFGNGR